jgi:hypothetical protein
MVASAETASSTVARPWRLLNVLEPSWRNLLDVQDQAASAQRVSADNRTVFLSVAKQWSTDVAPGTRSVQSFSNSGFVCTDDAALPAGAAVDKEERAERQDEERSGGLRTATLAGAVSVLCAVFLILCGYCCIR